MPRSIHVFRSPDRFVAGTVGEPGNRTFYLQAVHETRIVTVMLEKQQVSVLAERIGTLLSEVHRRFGTPIPPEPDVVDDLNPLVMPVDAEFRVGTMGLGWDAEANSVVVELLAVSEQEFDARWCWMTPRRARRGSGISVSGGGATVRNPLHQGCIGGPSSCPLCEEPLDPAGHICVRTNGYRRGTVPGTTDDPDS